MNVTLSINAGEQISMRADPKDIGNYNHDYGTNPEDLSFSTTGQGSALDFESVHVGMDGETRSDHGDESVPTHRCTECGEYRTEDGDPECTSAECDKCDGEGSYEIDGVDEECDTCKGSTLGEHRWEEVPATFANSAGIHLSEDGGVTVTISVGDPRGNFAMTIRRGDNGALLMHVPYVGMAAPHMELTEVHPGTYRIG